MHLTFAAVVPHISLARRDMDKGFKTSAPLATSAEMSLMRLSVNSPIFPFTNSFLPLTLTSTPDGILIGCLAILDMATCSPSKDPAKQLTAHIRFERFFIREHTPRRGQN